MCVTLSPTSSKAEKTRWRELLSRWAQVEFCPLEDPDFRAPQRPAAPPAAPAAAPAAADVRVRRTTGYFVRPCVPLRPGFISL